MHWTKPERADNLYKREDKVIWLKVKSTLKHMRATKNFNHGLLLLTPKEKEKKLFTRESSQQAKEEREIFLGFLFNYYYYKQEN